MTLKSLMTALTFMAAGIATANAVAAVDPAIQSYVKTSGL
jgi:phosphate transport system substrate-binding protein